MKKVKKNTPEDPKTDLKHDNLEFTPTNEDEDISDIEDTDFEEEEVTAAELEELETDEMDEAAAYVEVENELSVDGDLLPEEDWTDDLPKDISGLNEGEEDET